MIDLLKIRIKNQIFSIILLYASFDLNAQQEVVSKDILIANEFIDAFRLEQIGSIEKAQEIYEKLIIEPTAKANAHYQLARIYDKQNKIDLAINAINQSTIADPTNKWSYIFKANLLEKYASYKQVAECYEQLMKIEPNNYTFYDNAAINYLKVDNLNQSMNVLNQAEKKFGLSPSIAVKKANLFTLQKKENKAIEVLETAIKQYPHHTELYPELILLCKKNNIDDKVKTYTNTLANYDSQHPFLNKNEPSSKIENNGSLEEIIAKESLDINFKIKLLLPILKEYANNPSNEQKSQLLKLAKSLCNQYKTDPKPYVLLGDIYFQTNDWINARNAYIESIQNGIVPYNVYDNLILSLTELEAWISIEKYTLQALDIYPNQANLFYNLARAQYEQNNHPEALNNVDQTLLMTRSNNELKGEANCLKARILQAMKKENNAKEFWTNAITNNNSPLVTIQYQLNELQQKQKCDESALSKAMEDKSLSLFLKLFKQAEISYARSQYQESIKSIQEILIKEPNTKPSVYLLLSKNYKKLNNITEAIANAQKALELSEFKTNINQWIKEIEAK